MLLNFSKRDVEIKKDEKFFRAVFFEHADVSNYRPERDESISRSAYKNDLTKLALNDYSKNFLDIPEFDNEFYAKTAGKMFFSLSGKYKKTARFLFAAFIFPLIVFWIWIIALFGSTFFLEKKIDIRDVASEIASQINSKAIIEEKGN